MAYDLAVGVGGRERLDFVGSIDFDDLPSIARLLKRSDSKALHFASNLFEHQRLDPREVETALNDLLPLMTQELKPGERAVLNKLIAALAYAHVKQRNLYGIAD